MGASPGHSGDTALAATRRASLIRDARKRRDWSIAKGAVALIRTSPDLRLDDLETVVRTWKRWERGVRPSGRYRGPLSEVLGIDRTLLADDEALLAVTPTRLGVHEGDSLGAAGSLTRAEDDDDVRRRRFLELVGAAMLSGLDDQLEVVRRGFDWGLGHDPVGVDVADWERTAHAYGREVVTVPPGQLLPDLVADFDELRAVLAGRLSPAADRDLTWIAGQLAALIAIDRVGLGEHQSARRWWRTAKRAADRSGDPALRAFVRGRQAVMALYGAHEPTDVLNMADDAVDSSQGMPCAGAVSGLAARAQALAIMADGKRARATLGELASMFDRLPDHVARAHASVYGWSEQKLRHVESYVYTRLGETRPALRAQDQAVALYPRTNSRGPAQLRLHRAECLIIDGDIAEGARYASSVLETLSKAERGDSLVQGPARAALAAIPDKARTLPAVSEYREVLDEAANR